METANNEVKKTIPTPTSFGVIDKDGNAVIPCEYKSIRDVKDKYLIAEAVEAVSDSVKERVALYKENPGDPVFVTTNSAITENIYANMGSKVELSFKDQCSEATIYDFDGNNIVNGEYYSFIAVDEAGKVYASKNVVGSPVVMYDPETKTVTNVEAKAETVAEQPVQPAAPVSAEPQIPVVGENNVPEIPAVEALPQDEVKSEEAPVENVEAAPATEEQPVEETTEEVQEAPVAEAPVENVEAAPTTEGQPVEETAEEVQETPVAEAPVENVEVAPATEEQPVEETTEEVQEAPVAETQPEVPVANVEAANEALKETAEAPVAETPVNTESSNQALKQALVEEAAPAEATVNADAVNEALKAAPAEETSEDIVDFDEDEEDQVEDLDIEEDVTDKLVEFTEEKSPVDDVLSDIGNHKEKDTKKKKSTIDDYLNNYVPEKPVEYNHEAIKHSFEEEEDKTDDMLPDVLITMKKLVSTNKAKDFKIKGLEDEKRNYEEVTRTLKEKVLEMKEINDELNRKNESLMDTNERMNQKISDQKEVIEEQKDEIHEWAERFDRYGKNQQKWRREIKSILNSASGLGEDEFNYEYESYGSKRKAA